MLRRMPTSEIHLKSILASFLFCVASVTASAQATKPGTYYVKVPVLDERLAPSNQGTSTNRIYLRQKVEVVEIKGDWARVSKYYDGTVEGKAGMVARWVSASGLSTQRPSESPQPVTPNDPRIAKDAISKVGQGGLSEKDVQILYKGALKFLNSGKCSRVELGDKSISKPNTYYINCGGSNIFFTPSKL
jgi:hypothetical protein